MIVCNEEDFLPECLRSVEGTVNEMVIVDTGSTDRTPEVALKFGARCFAAPWAHDFAGARNISLQYATGDYILVMDADEVLTAKGRSAMQKSFADFPGADAFFVHILNQTDGGGMSEIEESLNVRLFRNDSQYRFSGALHEQIAESILHADPPGRIFDSGIEFIHRGYLKSVVANKGKKERNLEIALREAKNHPGDGFRAFNLGLEYVRLERWDAAVRAFQDARDWSVQDALWVSRFYKIYASTLMQTGLWEQAGLLLEEALVLFPDYTDLVYLKGVCLYQQQEWSRALQCYAACVEMGDPPIPPYTVDKGISTYRAYFAMGQIFQIVGKSAEAIASYRLAFEQNPSFQQSYLCFANLLLRADAGSTTLSYVAGIAALAGERQNALLGMALAQSDQFEQAKAYLEEAEKTGDVVEHLALVYTCLNEGDRVRELLAAHDRDGAIRGQVRQYLFDRGMKILEQGLRQYPQSQTLLALKAHYEKELS